ncbi:hypothetical protein FACS18948_5580 [Clostridia bacterium]|nr:hypothetical protein FACS18948_5580 [Clostridia bacterium]
MRIQNNSITGNTEFRVTAGECCRVREFITAYNYQPSNLKKIFTYTPGVFTYRTLVESIPTQVDNDWVELLTWMDVRAGMDERNAGMKRLSPDKHYGMLESEDATNADLLSDCLEDEGVNGTAT